MPAQTGIVSDYNHRQCTRDNIRMRLADRKNRVHCMSWLQE